MCVSVCVCVCEMNMAYKEYTYMQFNNYMYMQGFIQNFKLGGGNMTTFIVLDNHHSGWWTTFPFLKNWLVSSNRASAWLLKIAVEGPELSNIQFHEIMDIFKEKNRRIAL